MVKYEFYSKQSREKTTKSDEPRKFIFEEDFCTISVVKMAHEMISVTMAGDFTVQGVYANPGLFIKKGENLCSLKNESTGNITKVKAPSSGKALRILVKKQSKVQQG